jgi:hypothetical protein
MATTTSTANATNATAAEFRAWAQFVHDVFANGGWTQTTDTGQINLTTVAAPGAANTKMGYELWETSDAYTKIVVKIAYGSASTGATIPAVWFAVGIGSDGAGTLVDPNDGNREAYLVDMYNQTTAPIVAGAALASAMDSFGSADGGRAVFVLFEADPTLANNAAVAPNPCVWSVSADDYNSAASNYTMFFSIERGRDADGNIDDSFIVVMWTGSTGATRNAISRVYARETDISLPDIAPVQHLGYHVPFSEQGAIHAEYMDELLPSNLTATGLIPMRWRVYPAPPAINAIVARHSIFKFDADDGPGCAGMGTGAYITGRTAAVSPYGVARTYRTAAGLRWFGPAAQEEQFSYVWVLFE